jgi:ammonia/methane monooxygenase subunit B/beta-ketoacyl synthase-like protein
MKIIKDKVAKLSFVALLVTMTAAMFYAPTASAHGEKSQAAFMRMRTIHWFDLNWSKEEVPVNDTMTISGKFLVFKGWPETVDKPEVSFLNIGIPGPVFIRAGSWIGGQLVPRSVLGGKENCPPMSSIKGQIGHCFGAAGGIEAVTCLMAMRDGIIPPTINYTTPDENCDLDIVPNASRKAELNVVMSNSFGFGGTNGVLIFKKI